MLIWQQTHYRQKMSSLRRVVARPSSPSSPSIDKKSIRPQSISGFSLVEMIIVIVILGILGIGGSQLIANATQGMIDASRRATLSSTGRIAVEKIARELREALPNSVRLTTTTDNRQCLEFMPILAGSTYLSAPFSPISATSLTSIPFAEGLTAVSGRASIFPLLVDNVYAQNSPGPVSTTVANLSAPDGDNIVTLTLTTAFSFLNESPRQRLYIVDTPIAYCLETLTGKLFRYQNFGLVADTGNLVSTLPTQTPDRILVVDQLNNNGVAPFAITTASGGALITLDFRFSQASELIRIKHDILLRNEI